LLFEQPELHLHPAAQAALGSVLAKFPVENGRRKNLIVETHSENLILRLQNEVAVGNLQPDDVAILFVEPSAGGHRIVRITLDHDGEFVGEWPRGFFEESYWESVQLARTRSGRGKDA
jgi:predicted ATPase